MGRMAVAPVRTVTARTRDLVAGRRRAVRTPARGTSGSVRRLMLRFFVAGLIGVVLLAAVTALVARRVGTGEALDDARRITVITGRAMVEPSLTPELVAGDPTALAAFDRRMRPLLLDGAVRRIKLWNADGRVLYSDQPQLIGRTFPVGAEEREILRSGGSEVEVTDLSKPENRFERADSRLLEVYTRVRGPGGQPLIYELYLPQGGVSEAARHLWMQFAPTAIGALLALQLIQLPLAWVLARRLRSEQASRERLLEHAIAASDRERRRIAGDLHDGVVQDLSGVSFSLAATARRAAQADGDGMSAEDRAAVTSAAESIRDAIRMLRTMIVDIYPPNLHEEGLEPALADLAAGLRSRGVTVEVAVTGAADLAPATTALVYRITQEALRNVVAHSGACAVTVGVRADREAVHLRIEDNGRGFDPSAGGAAGHVGLRVMADLVDESGGVLDLSSAPGRGTLITVEVPR